MFCRQIVCICWIHSAHTTKCLDGYNKMFRCSDKQIQQTHVSQSVKENAVDVLGAHVSANVSSSRLRATGNASSSSSGASHPLCIQSFGKTNVPEALGDCSYFADQLFLSHDKKEGRCSQV